MAKITFTSDNAKTVYMSMAEGMWEVQEDNAQGGDTDSLLMRDSLNRIMESEGDLEITIQDGDVEAAKAVLDNCAEGNDEFWGAQRERVEECDEDLLFWGEVDIDGYKGPTPEGA